MTIELPALPEPRVLCRFMPGDYRYGDVHGFTADQMRAYATAAVLAESKLLKQKLLLSITNNKSIPEYPRMALIHEIRNMS